MPLVAGRYPAFAYEWALDGQPNPPYRQSISRADIATGNGGAALAATTGVMAVVPLICQPGDVVSAIGVIVGTAAATPTHSWVALYTGVTSAATLIWQSADVTTGIPAGAQKFALSAGATIPAGGSYLAGGTPGSSGSSGGPVVLGVGIMFAAATMPKFDGMLGSSGFSFTGQVPLIQTAGSALAATAPATLSGIAASNGPVPYVVKF